MDLGNGLGHLTYSTLVHPGDTWDDMWTSLTTYVPQVQKRVCPSAPFGVSLRLSNASASTLVKSKPERDKLKSFLADSNMYLYTVNAFPYGPFKNQIVKKEVYEPDWSTDARAVYTMQVADILAEMAAPHVQPSIQSPPLGFKPKVTGPEYVNAFTRHVISVIAHMVQLEKRTGRTVTLALEPEPACFLETTEEAVAYFKDHLYAADSVRSLMTQTGLSKSQAETALRNHLGMVYDICHQAVEYEDIGKSLQALADAGIPVFKLQEAAALRVPVVTQEIVEAMRPFAETVYLTQTVEMRKGKMTRYLNLEDAFAAVARERLRRRRGQTQRYAERLIGAYARFHLRNVAVQAVPHLAPRIAGMHQRRIGQVTQAVAQIHAMSPLALDIPAAALIDQRAAAVVGLTATIRARRLLNPGCR